MRTPTKSGVSKPSFLGHCWPAGRGWLTVSLLLVALGAFVVRFDTRLVILILPLMLMVSLPVFDFVSRKAFKKRFRPPDYGPGSDNADRAWSDWLLGACKCCGFPSNGT